MLPRRNRVSKREFKEMLLNGSSKKGELLAFRFSPSKDNSRRYAVVVPKKLYKTAVSRHVVKRRLVAIIRELFDELPNYTAAFFIIKSLDGVPREVLVSEMRKLLGITASSR